MRPLLSILIPTYNRARFLDECLYSLSLQDYRDCEILVRDNHSSDETPRVAADYRAQFQNFHSFRYKRNHTNTGFRDNMVEGVADCRGRYTLILMDDDFLASRRALSSFAAAVTIAPGISLAVAPVESYWQGEMPLSAKEIIDRSSESEPLSEFSIVAGEHYFLNAWTRYPPICLSSALFDRDLLIESPWSSWSVRAGIDVNLYHAISLNQKVAVSAKPLVYYRKHSRNDFLSAPVEDHADSHSHIRKWYLHARTHSRISRLSLFVWKLKTNMLKSEGPLRWMQRGGPEHLEEFLCWLRRFSYLDYLVLRYLSPQMIEYDGEQNGARRPAAALASTRPALRLRRKCSKWILRLDRYLHDRPLGPAS